MTAKRTAPTRPAVLARAASLGVEVEVRDLAFGAREIILTAPRGMVFEDLHERVFPGYPGEPIRNLWREAAHALDGGLLVRCEDGAAGRCEWCNPDALDIPN